MKTLRLSLTTLAAATILAACGKDDTLTEHGPESTGALAAAVKQAEETSRQDAVPKADPAKPLSTYPEVKSGQQVMFLYVAASKLPPDFEKLAENFSREYRQSNDAFRKNDLLQALKPQLEQGIAQAAENPYGWVELSDADLQTYDFTRKGFTVGEFTSSGRYRYFNDASGYRYTWANGEQVAFAPVEDEAIARELEAMRSKWNATPRLKVYFYAQSADLNSSMVNAVVTRVQITNRSGHVLVEYGPDGSAPVTPREENSGCQGAACIANDVMG